MDDLLTITVNLAIGSILLINQDSISPGTLAFPESGFPGGAVHIQNRF